MQLSVKAYLAQKTLHILQPRQSLVNRLHLTLRPTRRARLVQRKKQRRKNQLKHLKVKNTLDSSELTATYCVRLLGGINRVD